MQIALSKEWECKLHSRMSASANQPKECKLHSRKSVSANCTHECKLHSQKSASAKKECECKIECECKKSAICTRTRTHECKLHSHSWVRVQVRVQFALFERVLPTLLTSGSISFVFLIFLFKVHQFHKISYKCIKLSQKNSTFSGYRKRKVKIKEILKMELFWCWN